MRKFILSITVYTLALLIPHFVFASNMCSGSYLADKDHGAELPLSSYTAQVVLHDYVLCGLQSMAKNGWRDVAGLDLKTIEAQIYKVDVRYVRKVPLELLPKDQQGRGSAVFHRLNGKQWQILIVHDDLQKRFNGERYLLLFHELISTLEPALDLNFGATIEFEFKALQANTPEFQKANLTEILLPFSRALATGPITSGGGDSTLLWLKRQLRNYFIDLYLVAYMHGKGTLSRGQLIAIFQAISFEPMRLEDHLGSGFEWQKSSEGGRMLVVNPTFFHMNYDKYLSQLHDPVQAAKRSSADALRIIAESLKTQILNH